MYTRRDFAKHLTMVLPMTNLSSREFFWDSALDHTSTAQKDTTVIRGVSIGLEGYSLTPLGHDTVLDETLNLMVDMGVREFAMWDSLMQPTTIFEKVSKAPRVARGNVLSPEQQAIATAAKDALRNWTATVSLDYFYGIRKKFNAAKINIYSVQSGSFSPNSTDEELQRSCDIAKALGARAITTGVSRSLLKRYAPVAAKNNLKVEISGRLGAAPTDHDAISTPADYIAAVSYGRDIGVELDVGDATAAGIDTLDFLRQHHDKFYRLNLKDRKRDHTSVPWGQGDTPIKELLLLIRDNSYPIRCYIDCDYATAPNSTRSADVKACLNYIKDVLNS